MTNPKQFMLTIDFFKFGLDNHVVNAWFRGMYESFFAALRELSVEVTYSDGAPNKDAGVLVVTVGGGQDRTSAQAMQKFNGPVILNVGAAAYWFRRGFLNRWKDKILFVYGTDFSDFSFKKFAEVGIPYYNLPFASNADIMHPLDLPRKYDVVFVGNAKSGRGRYTYIDLLMKALPKRKILLVGPGWERYGFPSQSIAWGELLNIIYNLGKVCINISNDEQVSGSDKRLDANNRLFDLAMAGCFQISNAPQIVRVYFDELEVVAMDTPEEWVDAIVYYLDHPSEMEPFRIAARKRALTDHTWDKRAEQFLGWIEVHLSTWKMSDSVGTSKRIGRLRDLHLPPYGIDKAKEKIKRRVCRFTKS